MGRQRAPANAAVIKSERRPAKEGERKNEGKREAQREKERE